MAFLFGILFGVSTRLEYLKRRTLFQVLEMQTVRIQKNVSFYYSACYDHGNVGLWLKF